MRKCTWIFALILLISGGAFADQTFYPGASAPEGYIGGGGGDRVVCEITCPPNAIPENEPVCYDGYRDSTNTGCNCDSWSPPTICTFSNIDCGDTICGTSGTYSVTSADGSVQPFRDTDWYRLVLTSPATITWSAYAEFPVLLFILRASTATCYDYAWNHSATGDPCQLTTVTSECLPAGEYYLWIGPQTFDGLPCGLDYYAWVECEPCTFCDPTEIVRFFPDGSTNNCQCVDLCPGAVTQVAVCGTSAFPPVVHILPGCQYTFPGCLEECPPAQFTFNSQNWAFDPSLGCWVNYIIGLTPGCACVCFDHWLPVELTSFDAVAGIGSVTLRWSTASETNSDRFELLRDGSLIARVPAMGASTTTHHYSYTDRTVENGVSYVYSLRSIDLNGVSEEHGTVNATPQSQSAQVTEFALHQNFPNPFNPTTSIAFDLPEASFVTLKVYNLAGQEVATLVSGSMNAGQHSMSFDGSSLASGVYLYRLTAGSFAADRKMLLMK